LRGDGRIRGRAINDERFSTEASLSVAAVLCVQLAVSFGWQATRFR